MKRFALALLMIVAVRVSAQSVVISAHVVCQPPDRFLRSRVGPIVGVIINQTQTTITDLEVERAIVERSSKGIKVRYYRRFVVVPSLNQVGLVRKVGPGESIYFSIPDEYDNDALCEKHSGNYDTPDDIPNVAAISVTRVNNKSVLPVDQKGKSMKHVPLEAALIIPAETPNTGPALYDITSENARLSATIINRQLKDCLSSGTWACTFKNGTNINVVISDK
jgi:hypothetical protein